MKKYILLFSLFCSALNVIIAQEKLAIPDSVLFSGEKHFKNIRQLTFGGDNAEAYWSFDGKSIIFQRTNPKEGLICDQIFIGKIPTKPEEPFTYKMVSSGKGRTTCSYFLPDGKHIIMLLRTWVPILARQFQIVQNMATSTFGLCMIPMIFSWQI